MTTRRVLTLHCQDESLYFKLFFSVISGRAPRTVHKSRIVLNDVDSAAGDQTTVGVRYSHINTGKLYNIFSVYISRC